MSIHSVAEQVRTGYLTKLYTRWLGVAGKLPHDDGNTFGEDLAAVGFAIIATGFGRALLNRTGAAFYFAGGSRVNFGTDNGPDRMLARKLGGIVISLGIDAVDDLGTIIQEQQDHIDGRRPLGADFVAGVQECLSDRVGKGVTLEALGNTPVEQALKNFTLFIDHWDRHLGDFEAKQALEAKERQRQWDESVARTAVAKIDAELKEFAALIDERTAAENPAFGAW